MLSQVSFHKGGVTSNASLDMSHGRVPLPQTWDLGTLPPPPLLTSGIQLITGKLFKLVHLRTYAPLPPQC